jgi:hypothetical protein
VEAEADAATAVQRLSRMDALMTGALADIADVVEQLERAAERDEQDERGFVVGADAEGVMLQGFEKTCAAMQAL